MISRGILVFFVIALFVAVASSHPENKFEVHVGYINSYGDVERSTTSSLEAAKQKIKDVLAVFEKAIHMECMTAIYKHCKINIILHPKKYYNCAENYIKEHCNNGK